jgi:hypothetical protein
VNNFCYVKLNQVPEFNKINQSKLILFKQNCRGHKKSAGKNVSLFLYTKQGSVRKTSQELTQWREAKSNIERNIKLYAFGFVGEVVRSLKCKIILKCE